MSAAPSFETVNAAALAQCPGLLESWLPGGRVVGGEYVCGDIEGGTGQSFGVNLTTGKWSDFANADHSGGDLVSLHAMKSGLDQVQALRELADSLGVSGGLRAKPMPKPKPKPVWVAILPVPADAPPPTFDHKRHGKPSVTWAYRDRDGNTLGHTCRFDPPDGKKEILPRTYGREGNGSLSWDWKSWHEPRPLYGLDRLAQVKADAGVLLVEGEKTADAAARLRGPGKVCMTWPGGSGAVGKVDLSPLAGRPVGIWPDADEPGFKAALVLADLLKAAGVVSVAIIVPPAEAAQGWDLADAEAEGWTADKVTAWLRDNSAAPERFQEIAQERFGIGTRVTQDGGEIAAEAPIEPVRFDAAEVSDVDPAALPALLSEFCGAVAESLQVPFELPFINALACIAVAGQRRFEVLVREGYSEPINIYAVAALPPGERKSGTVEACKGPLIEWEAAAQEEAKGNIRDLASERKTLERVIEAKRTKAGRAKPEELRALIDEIKALEAELPEVPASPRLLMDDATPEAIPHFLSRQQERAGIIEAEGGLFETLAGRYSSGVPNLDAVLKFWGGEAVHVDRRSGEAIVLNNPALTICLTPQPEVIRGMVDKPGFRGRGLVGRFLFFLPKSRVGSRDVEPQPIPQAVQARYSAKLKSILNMPWALDANGKPTSYILKPAPGAYQEWKVFYEAVEHELGPGGEFELMADWAGKLHGAVMRLAGLLHLAEHDTPHEHLISLNTMRQAIALAAVLTEHAKAAFALMGADPDIECAKHILAWIVDRRIEAFKAREAFKAVEGRYRKMDAVNAGLSILKDRAFIFEAQLSEREKGKAGRPASPGYMVNPLAFGGGK